MQERRYQTFMLSDEPKVFGIPIVSGFPCIALTIIGLVIGYTFQAFVIGALISVVLHYKFSGYGIRFFLSVVYWRLPGEITKTTFGLRRSPASRKRFYLR